MCPKVPKHTKQDAEPGAGGSTVSNNKIPLEQRVELLEHTVKQLLALLSNSKG